MTPDVSVLLSRRIFSAIQNFSFSRLRMNWPPRMALPNSSAPDTSGSAPGPLVAVFRQALATFPPKNDFPKQFQKLQKLMDLLRAEDLGLDPMFSDPALWEKPRKPPCTYIEVFQNQHVNMGIFILAPGYKMPLHDHPRMHGLLKVISGAVSIRTFTEYDLTDDADDDAVLAKSILDRIEIETSKRRKFFAKVNSIQTCQENSPACVLTPTSGNLHEIQALQLPAAFFDILSPPYGEEEDDTNCHYFKVTNEISTNLVRMEEIDLPDDYYCDTAPYLGPLLS